MDDVKILHGQFGLVGLQMSDEVTPDGRGAGPAQLGEFADGLLNFVFSDIRDAGGDGGSDGVRRLSLGHGHKSNRRRVASGPAGRISDALAHDGNALRDQVKFIVHVAIMGFGGLRGQGNPREWTCKPPALNVAVGVIP